MNNYYWYKKGCSFGGIVIHYFNGTYHLFTTLKKNESPKTERVIAHFKSNNMVDWEELPPALGSINKPNTFESFTMYDLQVFEHEQKYYLFYTGLDIPNQIGQKQAIGVAISEDLLTWKRYEENPILNCDPNYYEQAVPDETCYQEKDRGRMWFRDPWIVRDPETKEFGMAVGARSVKGDPDLRACFAWATSKDLLNWTAKPPIFSPQRFHTLECPVIFENNGFWYCIYLTHHRWGIPFVSDDAYTCGGGFYAVNSVGQSALYDKPSDELLVGGNFVGPDGLRHMRTMVFRAFEGPDHQKYISYHFKASLTLDDEISVPEEKELASQSALMPMVKSLSFSKSGEMWISYNSILNEHITPVSINEISKLGKEPLTFGWWLSDGMWVGKDFGKMSCEPIVHTVRNLMAKVDINLEKGIRAGIAIRANFKRKDGICILLDYAERCVVFALLDGTIIDRRTWHPKKGTCELRVIAQGPGIEIYCDDKLMLHQARYRENGSELCFVVEKSFAKFSGLEIHELNI